MKETFYHPTAKKMVFPDASGVKANMLFAADASCCDMLDRLVQSEVMEPGDHCMYGMAAPEPHRHQGKRDDDRC